MSFKDVAILSSKNYYDFLDRKKGSLIKYNIKSIDKDEIYYYLTLDKRVFSLEYLQLMIYADVYSEIEPISFDTKKFILKVSVKMDIAERIDKAEVHNIKIISDLKFLVKGVENFYRHYGDRLQLPTISNNVNYVESDKFLEKPSEEQFDAILGALNLPLSYIWGAPGTGKTKFVLARCVLADILANKKVLIVAPTNNAIEQTLYGVINVLEEYGIAKEKIFRLGTASFEFASQYSEYCEDTKLEKYLKELSSLIKSHTEKISEIKEMISNYQSYINYKKFKNSYEICKSDCVDSFTTLEKLYEVGTKISNSIKILSGKIVLNKGKLSELSSDKSACVNSVNKLSSMINKNSTGIRKKLFKNKVVQLKEKLEYKNKELNNIENKMNQISSELNKVNTDYEHQNLLLMNNKNEVSNIIQKMHKDAEFWNKLFLTVQNLNENNITLVKNNFENELENCKKIISDRKLKYERYEGTSKEDLMNSLETLQSQLDETIKQYDRLSQYGVKSKLENCSVVATTIDTSIRKLSPKGDFIPDHILLDEAGYCSFIKGATLCCYNCPITLFGDHMQLPPICEMRDSDFVGENENVLLWAQSSIYMEEINSPRMIMENYKKHNEPKFEIIQKFQLNHTFRFGEELAQILSEYIYSNNFHGDKEHGTEIYYVSCAETLSDERVSLTECYNIIKYLKQNPDENIGIITPYNSQKNILTKTLKENNIRENVLTVHKSQGREFDTVLFSVVDSTNRWFTDTLNKVSNGKCVVNTAVSRAKKKLVIFCNAKYWKTQKNQLIGKLVENATEIMFE